MKIFGRISVVLLVSLFTSITQASVYASPAIAHGRIFIRGEKNLYAIGH